ncbi:MAG: hypothetical protein ACK494_02970 [Planctomycetota bacterium]|jgi:hypothetical protein
MDLMGILVWLAVLVSLVVFIVMLVKTNKYWGALQTTLLVFLFLQAWCFLFFVAGVSSRRNGYVKALYDDKKGLLAKAEAQLVTEQKARDGDRINPIPDMNAYVPITNELNRLLVERGRVWRSAAVTQWAANEASVQLASGLAGLPVAAPGAEAAQAAVPTDAGLAEKSVVHVFGERTDERGTVPVIYLGEFVVSSASGSAVKLKPTASLTPEQNAAIAGGAHPTWSIYELMPLDSHNAFAAQGSQEDENAIFGRMDRQELAQLLGIDPSLADAEPTSLSVRDAIKARALQAYLNDGGRPPEGTPPEQIYVRVEFLKDHTVEVDAQEQRTATEGGFYDLSGRSVDARLKRGEDGAKVSFKAGDVVILDSNSSDDLAKQGIVKSLAPVFVRPLNDYEYGFREVRRQITAALQDAKLIERELAEMQKSQGIADSQVRMRQQERIKLDKDFAQYSKENEVITAEATRLDQQLAATRSELSSMYQQIQSLRDQIVANQRAATAAIDAVAPAPGR